MSASISSMRLQNLSPEDIRQRKFLKRGLQLSLLILGETGLGKSTFINTLCDQNLIDVNKPIPAEIKIDNYNAKIYEGGTQINLDLTFVPGFGDFVDNSSCTKKVLDYIEAQFQDKLDDECKIQRNRSFKDTRIHGLMYFIRPTGKGLRELDIKSMLTLGKRCNIIPIIAKADMLTEEEVKLNKKLIMADIVKNKIDIYNFTSALADIEEEDDDDDDIEGLLEGNPHNESIQDMLPFAVTGSTETMLFENTEFKVRRYPWGVAKVDDPDHSDFLIVRTCLLGGCLQDLKETTHNVHYEAYRSEKLSAKMAFSSNPGSPTKGGVSVNTLLDCVVKPQLTSTRVGTANKA